MPGARLQSITKLARNEIETYTKRDTVVICGGTHDAGKNESHLGLDYLNKFTNTRTNTNIMIISVPQRHDLSPDSCVNKEIHSFNRELCHLMENKESTTVLNCNIPREGFTRHGLHHNSKGKSTLALHIIQELTKPTMAEIINSNSIHITLTQAPTTPTPDISTPIKAPLEEEKT
jgi:hypothetical protein